MHDHFRHNFVHKSQAHHALNKAIEILSVGMIRVGNTVLKSGPSVEIMVRYVEAKYEISKTAG